MSATRILPERIEGRHVLIGLLIFFGIMLAANGVFLYYALGTFNGFETRDAYRTGLEYNSRIAADRAQSLRGWQPDARYDTGTHELVIEVRNRQGRHVPGLAIKALVRRPATDGSDRELVLKETSPGRYAAALVLGPGQWTLSAQLYAGSKDGKPEHRHKSRLWVGPDK